MTVEQAVAEYEAALKRLPRLASSDSVSKRNGLEVTYRSAYQTLVKLGERPQIRGKYRGIQ